ncbi:zinc-binding alcohol dehydrogenase family protein [Aquirufa antheringensis]|uniref:zinc-binding alcohol dehydrogenase family protein n=1 Tax=Aquirufa antheringensis TaxID=2516559 RepID=UPI00208DF8E3|nr:zinc-binding alcohol dehydrogenase family protein [Aquirufa antheringensis]USQ03598.1 zinc-binding alcohol dehydrogenase family protein [Aquirufa antheringensis]
MQQWICNEPGILVSQEAEMPQRTPGFSLLRVRNIGICGTDIHAFAGNQPFFSYPRILGHELAVKIVESDTFETGELATIIPYFNCASCGACSMERSNCCENIQVFGVHTDGGMREYIVVEDRYILPGKGLSADELALVEPLSIAAHGLRRAELKAGEKVLVMGAGPIGLFTILLAKIQEALVEVAEPNSSRLQFCLDNLGVAEAITGAFNTVIDATGNLNAIESGFAKMAHAGKYVLIGLQKQAISFSHPEFHKREATLMSSRNATLEDFEYVMNLFREGKIQADKFISHRFTKNQVPGIFAKINEPTQQVIKAMITLAE